MQIHAHSDFESRSWWRGLSGPWHAGFVLCPQASNLLYLLVRVVCTQVLSTAVPLAWPKDYLLVQGQPRVTRWGLRRRILHVGDSWVFVGLDEETSVVSTEEIHSLIIFQLFTLFLSSQRPFRLFVSCSPLLLFMTFLSFFCLHSL